MSDYTVVRVQEVENMAEKFDMPWEMRFLKNPLGTEQVAVSWLRLPPGQGQKGVFGHRHKTQEEVYFVVRGKVKLKLDDDEIEVEGPAAVRIAPETARAVHNESGEDAELLLISNQVEDLREETEQLPGFWAAE
jgi:uncharacterized cupin superfamily protein